MARAQKALRYPLPSSGGDNWKARAEVAEKEAERLKDNYDVVEIEVERLRRTEADLLTRGFANGEEAIAYIERAVQRGDDAEARHAALVEAARTACELLAERLYGSEARSPGHNARVTLETALSALPPPVPAEEGGGLKRCPFCAIPLKAETGSDPWWTHPVNGCVIGGKSIFPEDVTAWNTRPTQAPQDVAGLVKGWRSPDEAPPVPAGGDRYFVAAVKRSHNGKVYSFPALYLNAKPLEFEDEEEARLVTGWYEMEVDEDRGETYRETVGPDDALVAWCEVPNFAALRASPISQEDSSLVLAAADDSRELVEALTKSEGAMDIASAFLRGVREHSPSEALDMLQNSITDARARCAVALAAFQSRQEGK